MSKKAKPQPVLTRERVEQLYRDLADAGVLLGPLDIDDIRLALRDWLRMEEIKGHAADD
jgi:hypothetical protein